MNETISPWTPSANSTALPLTLASVDVTLTPQPRQVGMLTAVEVLMTCGRLFLAIVILVLNITTIFVFAREQQLRTRGNMLVISLTVTDLIMGVLMLLDVFTWVPGYSEKLKTSEGWCIMRMFTLNICAVASILSIVAIAGDRYLYIVHPFVYQRLITVEKLAGVIAFVWSLAAFYSTCLVLDNRFQEVMYCDPIEAFSVTYSVYGAVAILVTSFVITGILYTLIFCLAISKRRTVVPSLPAVRTQTYSTWHVFRQQFQVLKQSLAVFLVFMMCWSPHLVGVFLYVVIDMPYDIRAPLTMIGFLNSAVNFFIYVSFNRDFRRRILVWASRIRCLARLTRRATEHGSSVRDSSQQPRATVCTVTDGRVGS